MTSERKILLLVVVGVTLVLVVLVLVPRVRKELAPRLQTAWVAVEADGSGVAEVGLLELATGVGFRLHAVLEAETWDGSKVYYTEARRLRFGAEEVPPASLRRWDRPQLVRVLWFTVEGLTPYLLADEVGALDRFRFEESFRADWARTWSISGSLEPSAEGFARGLDRLDQPRFGTQRYHVRIELYATEGQVAPDLRFSSWSASELPRRAAEFPGVIVGLTGRLAVPSEVFGLTQIELAGAAVELGEQIVSWTEQRLAFSRSAVLSEMMVSQGIQWSDLVWEPIDLDSGPVWGSRGAASGDLAKVGDRVVVLFEDRGSGGRLDRSDLCFDYYKGPAVRSLEEVFVGDGLIEWASLGRAQAAPAAEAGPR